MNLIKVNTMPTIFNRMDDIIDGFVDSYRYNQARVPKYNVIENEKEYIVAMEIPGFEKEDVSIEHKDDILTISGTSKYSEKSERYFNSFENLEINNDRIDSSINNTNENARNIVFTDLSNKKEMRLLVN